MLYRLPADDAIRIEAVDDAGDRIFCQEYAPDDIQRLHGRIRIVPGELHCQ
jgi:hypothetical protein